MKTDKSIKNIVFAAIYRKVMSPEEWFYSKIHLGNISVKFDLEEEELPIFEISNSNVETIITTRRIIEKKEKNEIIAVRFEDIEEINYGNFKGNIEKPELSVFKVIDKSKGFYEFQMETGKASIGLICSINTIMKLKFIERKSFFCP